MASMLFRKESEYLPEYNGVLEFTGSPKNVGCM